MHSCLAQQNKAAHIHPLCFVNLVAELMEAVHAELVRLATELEAVKGQVQTECNALRDLFARTTAAMSGSGSQHDRRLNHTEAGRHLPQQFGGSLLDCGDFAFRMDGSPCWQTTTWMTSQRINPQSFPWSGRWKTFWQGHGRVRGTSGGGWC